MSRLFEAAESWPNFNYSIETVCNENPQLGIHVTPLKSPAGMNILPGSSTVTVCVRLSVCVFKPCTSDVIRALGGS